MNRTLRRPMFRIGGSAGTGITSGLDQPRKQYQEGTPNPYASNLMPGTLPGFLTSFGLDLLSRPPQGGFFQTVAASAKGPFETFQAAEMARAQQQGERDFLRSETDRKLEASAAETDKLIASREKIAGMTKGDENVMAYAEIFRDSATNAPNLIKGQNAVDFFEFKYNQLVQDEGVESVAVEPIDATTVRTKQQINNFKKANPDYLGKIYFDVASGKAVKFVRDVESGDLKLVPIDSADIDTTGENMPDPDKGKPGLFGQETKPGKPLKEILPDFTEPGFNEDFYQS